MRPTVTFTFTPEQAASALHDALPETDADYTQDCVLSIEKTQLDTGHVDANNRTVWETVYVLTCKAAG